MTATQSRPLRRGLPRVPGGDPWPAAGQAPAPIVMERAEGATAPAAAHPTEPAAPDPAAPDPAVNADAGTRQLRRGLPRVPGGEPWPPAALGSVPVPASAMSGAPAAGEAAAPALDSDSAEPAALVAPATAAATPAQAIPAATLPAATLATAPATTTTAAATPLRRGLPRVPGGEPWPLAGLAPSAAVAPTVQAAPGHIVQAPARATSVEHAVAEAEPPVAASAQEAPVVPATTVASVPAVPASAPASASSSGPVPTATATAAPAAAAAAPSVAAQKPVRPKAEARLYGSRTLGQWIKLVVILAAGAVAAAGILVLAARGVTTLPGVPAFLDRYPGEYSLPETAEPGFPWWAQWSHFLNIFLIALIIRSGYQVRTQQKPPAFWTPKRGGKKISINLWLHQSLDILWLVNGLIFVVLLFASGHWMRILPTSWEVFPNALSALLQYITLDWPVENGWVNYNSLQQLMYFIVVFVAAPLAAITGVRMSEFWPKNTKTLNRAYPIEIARAVHFPTMLFFVAFILVHVFLVFATGALRNLNHMFGGTDAVNWAGFWLFAAAIAVTAAGWYAARPIVLAPLARLSGQVSSR
ncbi:thiosulfate reductase cytochrome b subunit [Arthrobacter sp. UYCu512]|uniref:cytochrome b/b6 domain-containing protein n=1 Tax=Arthrobacter sp. UYCu512 TaxID=3156338 RepID=UPI003396D6AF